jgi:hypothetical protein
MRFIEQDFTHPLKGGDRLDRETAESAGTAGVHRKRDMKAS